MNPVTRTSPFVILSEAKDLHVQNRTTEGADPSPLAQDDTLSVAQDDKLVSRIARVIRRIIGAPDYDAYLAHHERCHPGHDALTREAFARDVLTRRYETPGNRCC